MIPGRKSDGMELIPENAGENAGHTALPGKIEKKGGIEHEKAYIRKRSGGILDRTGLHGNEPCIRSRGRQEGDD